LFDRRAHCPSSGNLIRLKTIGASRFDRREYEATIGVDQLAIGANLGAGISASGIAQCRAYAADLIAEGELVKTACKSARYSAVAFSTFATTGQPKCWSRSARVKTPFMRRAVIGDRESFGGRGVELLHSLRIAAQKRANDLQICRAPRVEMVSFNLIATDTLGGHDEAPLVPDTPSRIEASRSHGPTARRGKSKAAAPG